MGRRCLAAAKGPLHLGPGPVNGDRVAAGEGREERQSFEDVPLVRYALEVEFLSQLEQLVVSDARNLLQLTF